MGNFYGQSRDTGDIGPMTQNEDKRNKYIKLFNATKCNAEKMQFTKDIIMLFPYINLVLCDVICQVKSFVTEF